jgi:hypothetical protein
VVQGLQFGGQVGLWKLGDESESEQELNTYRRAGRDLPIVSSAAAKFLSRISRRALPGGRLLAVGSVMVYVVIGDHLLRGSSYHCTEDIAARRALNMKTIISSLACVCVAE